MQWKCNFTKKVLKALSWKTAKSPFEDKCSIQTRGGASLELLPRPTYKGHFFGGWFLFHIFAIWEKMHRDKNWKSREGLIVWEVLMLAPSLDTNCNAKVLRFSTQVKRSVFCQQSNFIATRQLTVHFGSLLLTSKTHHKILNDKYIHT